MTAKTILFVTYGGGHAPMVIPVIKELSKDPSIHVEAVALTTGGAAFRRAGLSFKGFKDFLRPQDIEALRWGEKLAAEHHTEGSGIPRDESVAYLGLSYQDLVLRHGEQEAAKRWAEHGRHAFLPLTVFERILDLIKPDMVVATNSPRSERAALEVAQAREIPALCMVDLFGYKDFHVLQADYFTVLSEQVIDTVLSTGTKTPREHFFVTGNPAFDPALDFRGAPDPAWKKSHFPALKQDMPCLLWVDMPAYFRDGVLYERDDKEVLEDLNHIARAAQENGCALLIRPHPSQSRNLFDAWVQGRDNVFFAGGIPLYPLLNVVDVVAVYSSTVSLEAVIMRKKLVQLKYFPEHTNMPLIEWGLAWHAKSPDVLSAMVGAALAGGNEWEAIQARMDAFTPARKAAPLVAAHIKEIIGL